MQIDPFRRELVKNGLTTIADNIVVSVIRTARSTLVKNGMDFTSSVCDAHGEMVAQGLALPSQLGATMPALRGCLDYFGDDLQPGDMIVNNDPYSGGSHLPDVFMFLPVFAQGERVAILGLVLHHTDMGGRMAGGNAADSNEIYEEGLRIAPCKIQVRGEPNSTVLRFIEHNVRVADTVLGDIRAQMAALNGAGEELRKLISDFEVAEFKAYMKDIVDYTERLARASIAALPDGEVEFTEWNDDDGVGHGPIRIHVKLKVEGDEITVDFSGTSPEMGGALHPNYWFTVSITYAALRTVLQADMPNNAGFYRPIKVIAPEGSWVNPRFPAAVGARGQGGYRLRSLILGALSQLVPERIPACTGGSEFGLVMAGNDENRKPYIHLEYHNITGHGGGPDRDGQDAGPYCLDNNANTPVEVIEAENPILVEEYGFIRDTGGAGRYRGSLGIARQYRLLADEALVNVRSDRHLHSPWGLCGGNGGAAARTLKITNGGEEEMPSKFIATFKRGDVLRAEMPGSGGFGDPLERDPGAVCEDVRQEKVSIEHALAEYGVVIDPDTREIDVTSTQESRRNARAARDDASAAS